ncbi:unnamed protein product [Prorocentrum cordatum]|uniref:Uncharacterized protein n=1 Tax=Prorocentrum cordatum TaxID=2364126 RepID=A0ABN9SJQ3_9DINO|nr:unnamed protein product [Polarella glacialis]
MRSLVRAEPSAANAGTPYDRRTPLHLAAAKGNTEMVRFLMEECGANLQRDRFGLLPIHDAVENGHNEVRRFLQGRSLGEEAFSSDACARRRLPSGSYMNADGCAVLSPSQENMSTVFELIVKEGIFSYNTVHAEVQHFFKGLGLHPIYFEHFTPLQVAKHIHCLISGQLDTNLPHAVCSSSVVAAKRVARATDNVGMMRFAFEADRGGFFLAAIDSPEPTEAQKRTEEKVAAYLEKAEPGKDNVSLTFMASVGPAFQQGKERLGIWSADRNYFDATSSISEDETSLEVLASTRFLRRKTKIAKAQYQLLMDDVVASRRSMVRVVEGSVYPGPYPGGFVLLFGTAETVGRHYGSADFLMMCHAMRFVGLTPRRFYCETFANGVITYSLFFPSAKGSDMQKLETIMYSTLLKSFPGKSLVIFNSVMQSKVSHEVGLYLLAAVKFVYQFFPKERYARQYTDLHKLLERDQASQRKLEDLYRLCMKELMAPERIYDLVQRNFGLAGRFFEDFQAIALGRKEPHFNEELAAEIDTSVTEPQDRQILRMFLTFNEGMRLTNFFTAEKSGAMSFRLDPRVVLKDRLATMYPEMPYGIYMVVGRDFYGFHVRFRDVARGGIRLVCSRTVRDYERNSATLFDECYNLALKQQFKNKDVPEGGAVGVILPDSSWPAQGGNVLQGFTSQSPVAMRSCFVRFAGWRTGLHAAREDWHLQPPEERRRAALLRARRAHQCLHGPWHHPRAEEGAPVLEGAFLQQERQERRSAAGEVRHDHRQHPHVRRRAAQGAGRGRGEHHQGADWRPHRRPGLQRDPLLEGPDHRHRGRLRRAVRPGGPQPRGIAAPGCGQGVHPRVLAAPPGQGRLPRDDRPDRRRNNYQCQTPRRVAMADRRGVPRFVPFHRLCPGGPFHALRRPPQLGVL